MNFLKKNYYYFLVLTLLFSLNSINLLAQVAPVLVSPANLSTCNGTSITFTWDAPASGTASWYGLQIAESPNSTTFGPTYILNVTNLSASNTFYVFSMPRSVTDIYWRVSTSFTTGEYLYSNTSTFTTLPPTTTLNAPVDAQGCVPLTNIVNWTAVPTATAYTLELNTSSTFDPGSLLYTVTQASTSITLTSTTITYNQTVFWRVNTQANGCWSGWSAARRFTTIADKPSLVQPANGATCVDRNTTFIWNPTPPGLTYHLEVYNSPVFGPGNLVFSSSTITSNTYTLLLPNYQQPYWFQVRTGFICGFTAWSNSNSFTTAQPTPVPLLPANGTTGVNFTTSMSWTSVPGVDSYRLQVSEDPTFVTNLVDVSGLTSTSYSLTIPGTMYNTAFHWRVSSSFTTCQSPWSNTFGFRTVYNPPTLSMPLNHRTCTPTDYRYQWYAVTNAAGYRLQISTDATFTNLVVNQANIQDLYLDVTNLAPLTPFFWRVRAEDATNTGAWSPTWDFTSNIPITQLISPANNASGLPLTNVLRWNSVSPGATYNLQVSTTNTFNSTLLNITTGSTSYTYTAPNYNATYYWRTSATLTTCSSTYSEIWSFRTVLNAPTLVNPANHAQRQPSQIQFQWNPVAGATSYIYQISNSSSFTTILRGIEQSATTYLVNDLLAAENTYYWRVAAKDVDGNSSPWSTVFDFSTHLSGPSVPVLQFPANNAEKVATSVTLRWLPSANTTKYHLQFSNSNNFVNNIIDNSTLTSTSYSVTGLENYRTYYWHVSAMNDSGETAYSETWSFRIIDLLPGSTTLLTPINNIKDVDTAFTLYWLAAQSNSTVQYTIQVATSNSFTAGTLVLDYQLYNLNYGIKALQYNKDYYWRAKGTNEAGDGLWSEVWKFTTKINSSVNDELEAKFGISAYPNPFSETALIRFTLPTDDYVHIKLINSLGAEIKTLASGQMLTGTHDISVDAHNLTSGVYWYSIQVGNSTYINRLILIK